jgi:ethanolamine ammonia-lyase large subunit
MRELYELTAAPEFAAWLEQRGIFRSGRLAPSNHDERRQLLTLAERALNG